MDTYVFIVVVAIAIAKLDANAGTIYGAGGDEVMAIAHRELRSLKQSRDIAANYRE